MIQLDIIASNLALRGQLADIEKRQDVESALVYDEANRIEEANRIDVELDRRGVGLTWSWIDVELD